MKKRFTTIMAMTLLATMMIGSANASSNAIEHRLNDFESNADNDALDEIKSLQKHYDWKAKSRLKKQKKLNSKNSKKVKKMKKTVGKTKVAIQSYSDDKKEYYKQIKASQAEMVEIENNRISNKEKMAALKEKLKKADTIDDLKDAQDDILDMQTGALAANKKNIKGKLVSISKLKKLKKKKSTNSAEKEKIDETIDEYLKTIGSLEDMQNSHKDDIASSKREIKRLDKHGDDLNWFEENAGRSKLNSLEDLDSLAIKQKKTAENDIDDLEADIITATASHGAATNRLQKEQDKLKGLQDTLDGSQTSLDDMRNNIKLERIDYAIDKIMNDADLAEEKSQFLLTDLDTLRNKLGVDENSRKYADDKLKEELAKLDNTPLGMYVQQKIAEAGGSISTSGGGSSDCENYNFCSKQGPAISDITQVKDTIVADDGSGETGSGSTSVKETNGPKPAQVPQRPKARKVRVEKPIKAKYKPKQNIIN